jgi:hypothetical protein
VQLNLKAQNFSQIHSTDPEVYYYTSRTLNGMHRAIGTVNGTRNGLHGTENGTLNGLHGTLNGLHGTENGTLNGLHGSENGTLNGLNGERFERFGLDFKICISETLAIYYFHH